MVPRSPDLGPRAAPQLHPSPASRLRGRTALCPGRTTVSSSFWRLCLCLDRCVHGGAFEVLVGPPQPRQPVGRVPRLGGGEAPACRASQPGAGLRRVPRPPVSPHPGLPSDGARVWPAGPRSARRAPPGCIDRVSAALRPRTPARLRNALRKSRREAPGLLRSGHCLMRPLHRTRPPRCSARAVSSVLFGAAGYHVSRGRGRAVSAVAMVRARVSAPHHRSCAGAGGPR